MRMGKICLAAAIMSLAWCSYGAGASTFLTGVEDPVVNLDAQLYGFEGESEVFAAQSGADSAFQGTVILDNTVLVADYRSEAIRRFSLGGTLLPDFASFLDPTYLEVDRSRSIYVTHSSIGPAEATRFDSAGNVTGLFTALRAGTFHGIDADAEGNVYVVFEVSGNSNQEIQKFAPDGTFLGSLPINTIAFDMAIDEIGERLYLAGGQPGNSGILVYDISGNLPIFEDSIAVGPDTEVIGLHYSADLGTLFATDHGQLSGDPRGLQLALDGTVLATYRPTGAELVFDITHRVPEPATTLLAIGSVLVLGIRQHRLHALR